MPKPKRINAYVATIQQETDEQAQIVTVEEESASPEVLNVPEEQTQTPREIQKEVKTKDEIHRDKKSHLKQVNMTLGETRELKLDELAFTYTKNKRKRVNRNDIVRYLIDTISIEKLLKVDLSKYER